MNYKSKKRFIQFHCLKFLFFFYLWEERNHFTTLVQLFTSNLSIWLSGEMSYRLAFLNQLLVWSWWEPNLMITVNVGEYRISIDIVLLFVIHCFIYMDPFFFLCHEKTFQTLQKIYLIITIDGIFLLHVSIDTSPISKITEAVTFSADWSTL